MINVIVNSIFVRFLLLLVFIALANHAQAQQGRPTTRPSPREAYEAAKTRERNIQNREWAMQHAGDADSTASSERLKTLSAQAREDFRRMQLVNNEMMRTVSTASSVDYKKIVEATGEINRCAKRLKTNLAALDTDEEEKEKKLEPLGPAEIKPALFSLDEQIMSFVTSLAVVDTENASRSRSHLRDVIELSDHIRRSAERIDKASKKR